MNVQVCTTYTTCLDLDENIIVADLQKGQILAVALQKEIRDISGISASPIVMAEALYQIYIANPSRQEIDVGGRPTG